jgi:hypothetical protein
VKRLLPASRRSTRSPVKKPPNIFEFGLAHQSMPEGDGFQLASNVRYWSTLGPKPLSATPIPALATVRWAWLLLKTVSECSGSGSVEPFRLGAH